MLGIRKFLKIATQLAKYESKNGCCDIVSYHFRDIYGTRSIWHEIRF